MFFLIVGNYLFYLFYVCSNVFQFVDIGVVTSIEMNHKSVDSAKKGQEICIKIEPIPGESPKMYGRHFEATDLMVSKVRTRPLRRGRMQNFLFKINRKRRLSSDFAFFLRNVGNACR